MSEKIYILTEGCYSDYHISGVTRDKEMAEKFHKTLNNPNEIQEWEVLTEKDLELCIKTYYYLDKRGETCEEKLVRKIFLGLEDKSDILLYFDKNTREYLGYTISLVEVRNEGTESHLDKIKKEAFNILNTIHKYLKMGMGFEEFIDNDSYNIRKTYICDRELDEVTVKVGSDWSRVQVTLDGEPVTRLQAANALNGWVRSIDGEYTYGDVDITIPCNRPYVPVTD